MLPVEAFLCPQLRITCTVTNSRENERVKLRNRAQQLGTLLDFFYREDI